MKADHPLGRFITPKLLNDVISILPEDFDEDQFTIAFIHYLPNNGIESLWRNSYTYEKIKKYLHSYVLREKKLSPFGVRRAKRYNVEKEYWTKDMDKKIFTIRYQRLKK